MKNKLMFGSWRHIINIPSFLREKHIAHGKTKFEEAAGFMTDEHRIVHHFVVNELPSAGNPLSLEYIAGKLKMDTDRVKVFLDDMEKGMTFLVRNSQGEVTWAFPVTVDKTPHHVTFDTGERIYAACAADTFATPFVLGQLRQKALSVVVDTECAHCSRPMKIEIDSDLNAQVNEEGCEPVVFVPDVDLFNLDDDNIIDAF